MCKENLSQLAGLMVTLLFVTTGLSYGQTVGESGEAGGVPSLAQDASGIPITLITGNILSSYWWEQSNRDIDMYRITINDPAAFSATTFGNENETTFDTCLFLFDSEGKAVYMNNDVDVFKPGSIRRYEQSTLPAGHPDGPTTAGDYYLAVTGYEVQPYDEDENLVFDTGSAWAVHGPSLSNKPVEYWESVSYYFKSGNYWIDLTGVGPIGPVLFDVTAMSQVDKSSTRFDRRTGQFSLMANWTNIGADQFSQPLKMVIESIIPDTVTVANADGTTSDGKPYFDYSSLAGDGNLDPGETSEAKPLMFNNPTRARFTFDVSCWASLDNSGPG